VARGKFAARAVGRDRLLDLGRDLCERLDVLRLDLHHWTSAVPNTPLPAHWSRPLSVKSGVRDGLVDDARLRHGAEIDVLLGQAPLLGERLER
jgi:hypothetical protein